MGFLCNKMTELLKDESSVCADVLFIEEALNEK